MATVSANTSLEPAARLEHWMQEALELCDEAGADLVPEAVHDLRVALRRCLAIADCFLEVDSDSHWRDMRKEALRLFKCLGHLRDAHVMAEWVRKIAPSPSEASRALLARLARQQKENEEEVRFRLRKFSRKKWKVWVRVLRERAENLPVDGAAFEYIALERWNEAYTLHRKALRGHSRAAFHRLRIGIKRFRYTVENFLPTLHEGWSAGLKLLQDLLGEAHDFQVLWRTALELEEFRSPEVRTEWKARIDMLCAERFASYRAKMGGRKSPWLVWRNALPKDERLESAAIAWLRTWTSFLTPDMAHAEHVTKLALDLYDQLAAAGLGGTNENGSARRVLEAAALAHDVGRARGAKSHHKNSYRMIAGLKPMIGWTPEDMRLAGLVARYHRRALPQPKHSSFARLSHGRQQKTLLLAGILRLANALDRQHDRSVRSLAVETHEGGIAIRAPGYSGEEPATSYIASAKHLIEIACKRPVTVLPAAKPPVRATSSEVASHAA